MNENAKKWVEALRSGKYEQGNGYLRQGGLYCCLGVACELFIEEHPNDLARELVPDYGDAFRYVTLHPAYKKEGDNGALAILPIIVKDWLGLTSTDGEFILGKADWKYNNLTVLNDEGTPFTEIADIIESEPERMFRDDTA
jgi:hypothetical protein